MEPKNNPNYFKSWGFTLPASYTAGYRIQTTSVDQIIAQYDIYDKLLANMETYPEAAQMLADIGIK